MTAAYIRKSTEQAGIIGRPESVMRPIEQLAPMPLGSAGSWPTSTSIGAPSDAASGFLRPARDRRRSMAARTSHETIPMLHVFHERVDVWIEDHTQMAHLTLIRKVHRRLDLEFPVGNFSPTDGAFPRHALALHEMRARTLALGMAADRNRTRVEHLEWRVSSSPCARAAAVKREPSWTKRRRTADNKVSGSMIFCDGESLPAPTVCAARRGPGLGGVERQIEKGRSK
jgi:hypothetical protein